MKKLMRILTALAFILSVQNACAQRTLVAGSSQWGVKAYTPAATETYSAWVKTSSTGGSIIVTCRGEVNDNHYRQLGFNLTAANASERAGGSAYSSLAYYTKGSNVWFHIAAVFRGNTYRRIFVDGVPATAETTSVTPTAIDEAWFGKLRTNVSSYYSSYDVAELAIWHAELTDAEISQLAAGGQFARRAHPSKIRPDKLVWLPDLSIPGAAVPGVGGVTGISNSPALLTAIPPAFR